MNKILWNSIKSPLRYFWVPAGEDVFAGEYQIENGDGEEASVDLESIVPFEINEKEAEAIMMKDLENMTAELGGLFKDLFKLGKRMVNSELMDDDSDDWDSEDDSSSDSESDWDSEDSEDSDFDEADLDKVISLFDLDSDEDSESSSDFTAGSIEELLTQFGEDLEGPLTELKDLIVQEVGNLGEELDKLGSQAAKDLDTEPEAGQDILREFGQWLINLADEQAQDTAEDVVVMEFKPKDSAEISADIEASAIATDEVSMEDTSSDEGSERESSSEESSESDEDSSNEEDSEEVNSTSDEEINTSTVDQETEGDTSETVETSTNELPSESALKRMTKAKLVDLGQTFGLTLNIKDTKKTLLEQLETIR